MISKKGSKAVSALVIALLVFQNGCGTVSREQMIEYNNKYKLPYKPRKDLALIYVVRSNALFAYNLSLNVFIDDFGNEHFAGRCAGSQYIHMYVKPGTHTLLSQFGFGTNVSFNTEAGKIYYVQLNLKMGMWRNETELFALDEVTGKYYLMNCYSEGELGNTNL